MSQTFTLEGPFPTTTSPFRLDSSVGETVGESPYAEPEVPDRELELFEALHEQVLGELDLQPGDTGLGSDPELEAASEHPISRLFRLPVAALDALGKGAYAAALTVAGTAGYRSVNDLTNMIFYFRHPEVIGRQIQPGEHDLSRDWLRIRDTIVRPALNRNPSAAAGRVAPVSSSSGRTTIASENLEAELWANIESAVNESMSTDSAGQENRADGSDTEPDDDYGEAYLEADAALEVDSGLEAWDVGADESEPEWARSNSELGLSDIGHIDPLAPDDELDSVAVAERERPIRREFKQDAGGNHTIEAFESQFRGPPVSDELLAKATYEPWHDAQLEEEPERRGAGESLRSEAETPQLLDWTKSGHSQE